MRILLNTALWLMPDRPVMISQSLDKFDPTFSARYLVPEPHDEYVHYRLVSEDQWEADKCHIFFLDIAKRPIEEFVNTLKDKKWCRLIAKTDDQFNIAGDPVYVKGDSPLFKNNGGKGPDLFIPRSIRQREQGFVPRAVQAGYAPPNP